MQEVSQKEIEFQRGLSERQKNPPQRQENLPERFDSLPEKQDNLSQRQNCSSGNIEIDNRDFGTDRVINTEKETSGQTDIYVPKVKEIVISRPVATGKERPAYTPMKKEGFVF